MPADQAAHPPGLELAELREEVHRLREAQEQQKRQAANGDGHNGTTPADEGQGTRREYREEHVRKRHPLKKAILVLGAVIIVVIATLW